MCIRDSTFPGDAEMTVDDFKGTANAIAVTVPAACAGSGFKLNLKKGTTVNIDGQLSLSLIHISLRQLEPGHKLCKLAEEYKQVLAV